MERRHRGRGDRRHRRGGAHPGQQRQRGQRASARAQPGGQRRGRPLAQRCSTSTSAASGSTLLRRSRSRPTTPTRPPTSGSTRTATASSTPTPSCTRRRARTPPWASSSATAAGVCPRTPSIWAVRSGSDTPNQWKGPKSAPNITKWSNGDVCPFGQYKGKKVQLTWAVDGKKQTGNPADYNQQERRDDRDLHAAEGCRDAVPAGGVRGICQHLRRFACGPEQELALSQPDDHHHPGRRHGDDRGDPGDHRAVNPLP